MRQVYFYLALSFLIVQTSWAMTTTPKLTPVFMVQTMHNCYQNVFLINLKN